MGTPKDFYCLLPYLYCHNSQLVKIRSYKCSDVLQFELNTLYFLLEKKTTKIQDELLKKFQKKNPYTIAQDSIRNYLIIWALCLC